jgi:hypothetical protein
MPNTGRGRYTQRDMNPNSPTYNQTRPGPWVDGLCTAATQYRSAMIVEDVVKNDCAAGLFPTTVQYYLPEGSFISYTKQSDADDEARAHFNATKQAYANQHGSCSTSSGAVTWLPNYDEWGCFKCTMRNSQDPTDVRDATVAEANQYTIANGSDGRFCQACAIQ